MAWEFARIVEPRPGLSRARNRALAEGIDTAYVAFTMTTRSPTRRGRSHSTAASVQVRTSWR